MFAVAYACFYVQTKHVTRAVKIQVLRGTRFGVNYIPFEPLEWTGEQCVASPPTENREHRQMLCVFAGGES